MESGVPNRQHLISEPDGIPHDPLVRFIEEVRLSTLRVNVSMGTEEGHESSGLVPSNEHLDAWVTEETTDIGCTDKVALKPAICSERRPKASVSESASIERSDSRLTPGTHVITRPAQDSVSTE
jgi:hypothetical protein